MVNQYSDHYVNLCFNDAEAGDSEVSSILRTRSWSSKLGHKICTAVWLLYLVAFAPVFVMKMISRVPVVFYDATFGCWYDANFFPD